MLRTLIDTWLAARRASGFTLKGYERPLHRFAEFARERGKNTFAPRLPSRGRYRQPRLGKDTGTFSASFSSPAICTPKTLTTRFLQAATFGQSGSGRYHTSTRPRKRGAFSRPQRGSDPQDRSGRTL